MKIPKIDLKHNEIKVIVENPNDLWELSKIILPDDTILAKTFRRIEISRGDQIIKGEKKSVFLGIRVEKIEFQESTGNLRLTGKIVEGPDDMSGYHTISLEEGSSATIRKQWQEWEIQKLKDAKIKTPKVVVCVLDDDEATIALIEKKINVLAEITGPGTGKEMGESDRKGYFTEIIQILKSRESDGMLIAGPGFVKDALYKELKDLIKTKMLVDSTAHTGITGVQEIIKRGGVQKVAENSRASQETTEIERFFEEVSKEGPVEYGKDQIEKAIEMGAVEKILICESVIRGNEDLMKKCEDMGGAVMVITEGHTASERLKGIGGIASFLRFKI